MRSNSYTLIFTSCITIVLSFFLSIASGLLKEKQIANVELDRKKNILIALGFEQSAKHLWKPKDIQTLFSDFVQEFNIDENGNRIETTSIDHESSEALTYFQIYKKVVKDKIEGFAIPISGKGLWSTLYGYLAVEPDGKTVKGITFYKHKETAGLGGEVEKPWFQNNFVGKQFIDDEGNLISIQVIKGKVSDDDPQSYHKVDGISGATITGRGLNKFLKEDLKKYEPFFKKIRSGLEI